MATLPKDLTDLHLAPVLLAIDRRLDDLEMFSLEELTMRVALDTNASGSTEKLRREGLLETVARGIEGSGWSMDWTPRGIRVTHERHHVTVGVPETFRQYVSGGPV